MKIPHVKLTNTIHDDEIPNETHNPAFWIAYMVATPPGTQNNPETIPHGVNWNWNVVGVVVPAVDDDDDDDIHSSLSSFT